MDQDESLRKLRCRYGPKGNLHTEKEEKSRLTVNNTDVNRGNASKFSSNLGVFQELICLALTSVITPCQYNIYGFSKLVAIALVPQEAVNRHVHRA